MLIFRTFLLQEAVRQGHEVVVLCPPDVEAARFSDIGVKHVPWTLRRGGGALNLLSAISDARRVVQKEQPDATVVYCVQPIMALLWAWKLGGGHGRLFPTFTGLGSLWTDLDPAPLKKRLVRSMVERIFGLLSPQATNVFVLNRDDKAQVAGWNPKRLIAAPGILGLVDVNSTSSSINPPTSSSRERGSAAHQSMRSPVRGMTYSCPVIQTLGEGVDLDHFKIPTMDERQAARARWGIPADAKVIGFVGRLIREKGAPDFLKLCKELKSDEQVHFLVVGDPDRGNPTSLSEKEMNELDAVPRLHREPWMTDVRPAYAAMDVLVFLSAREGLPVSPLEAMAMGVPVVAYDAVGTREIVPEGCIMLRGEFTLVMRVNVSQESIRYRVMQLRRIEVQKGILSSITNQGVS